MPYQARYGASFKQRVATWDKVAKDDNRVQEAIAPSRHRPEGYVESGARHAGQLVELVGKHPEWLVLDFGCGDGRVTGHLPQYYKRVYGADASPSMLDRLAVRCPDVRPVLWDGMSKPRGELPQFDMICSFLCFHHHVQADGVKMLRQLASCIRPGGFLALQIPLYQFPKEPLGWTSVGVWTPEQLVLAAQILGLETQVITANRGHYVQGSSGPHHGAIHLLHRPE